MKNDDNDLLAILESWYLFGHKEPFATEVEVAMRAVERYRKQKKVRRNTKKRNRRSLMKNR